ncbi:MAG: TRC40/GET3/ArsA family transport-energizing ATPase [Methanothrix sp.]|uniref:Putative arsenical pump-driving ATPase n=1 Tax=Methanothrix harundinacea TaxID=301375 RepID=A0A124FMD1_9EURY|nr:MAG: arsenic-transporting ATPase [Methanosaeta sp. SDB]KUK44412.1 MAG: Putative arsenical pump-driving ATPase [Methanothrix harundinacea]MDD2637647.1 TRC40/GET3/ArsA family transport-energizing ATPase [Methanothrix sp.]MDI9398818.1 TRC40/GET3/ArsA family transport-energizing ATPase [Euryarchaeota archaeon]KUK95706.1 MAG: Putative arsenical pump-driving ATPase [Methanothrix harundinacea]
MRLIYMAGKGGVGKSVCSAATGLWSSQQGNKTLAFSMDPAHSLSDILDVEIGDRPRKIAENFDAVEPDLAAEAEKFYGSYRSLFRALFEMFQFEVRPADFGVVPGVGELIFMDRLYDVYMEGNYEVVVIDSAPTALVLPLLKLPDVTTGVVTRLLGMKSRWTGIFNMLEPGFGDSIVTEVRRLRTKAETMRNALIDPEITTISVVTIPEKAAVLESERLIETVEAHEVTVDSIIVNHVMAPCDCDYCRRRAASQRGYIDEIKAKFADKRIALLPSYGEEVTGEGLSQVSRDLYEEGQLSL